jgi:UDP-glucose 4-epimerase
VSKVAADLYLACWSGLTGVPALTLRLANIYGPRQNPHGEAGVVAIFCDRLLGGHPCVINGDGGQTRDFVYVGDVADAVARAVARADVVGALNVATGVETTVNDLYARLARAAGSGRAAEHGPPRPGEQRRSVLDPRRAAGALGWVPATSLDEGLRRTFEAARREVEA